MAERSRSYTFLGPRWPLECALALGKPSPQPAAGLGQVRSFQIRRKLEEDGVQALVSLTPACLGQAGPEGSAEHGRGCVNLHTWADRTLSSLLALLAWYILEQVNPSGFWSREWCSR